MMTEVPDQGAERAHHHHHHHHHHRNKAPGNFGHKLVNQTPWATSSQSTGDLGSYSSYSDMSRAEAPRKPGALSTLMRPLEEREINRDPLARFTTATRVPKLAGMREMTRSTNALLSKSFPAGFLTRKRPPPLVVSESYDAADALSRSRSRILDPSFRFADTLIGAPPSASTRVDALPGAPSFGAVEYYSLPSPGGAIRRTPRSRRPVPQRLFDALDLPRRSPRMLVDTHSLSLESELEQRRLDQASDVDEAPRTPRSYAELEDLGSQDSGGRPASRALTVHLYSPTPTPVPGESIAGDDEVSYRGRAPAPAPAPRAAPRELSFGSDGDDAEEVREEATAASEPPSPASGSPVVENPFFVDSAGKLSVSLVDDAENVSALHPPSNRSLDEGPAIIMGTKYDDGESISIASYSRASTETARSPFTIGTALGLVRTELSSREAASRDGLRTAPAFASDFLEKGEEPRRASSAPSPVAMPDSLAEWDDPPPPEPASPPPAVPEPAPEPKREVVISAPEPLGPKIDIDVKSSCATGARRASVSAYLSEHPTLVDLHLTLGGALDGDAVAVCYAHPTTKRTVRVRTDADWHHAFELGRTIGKGELGLLVDLPDPAAPAPQNRPAASPPKQPRRASISARVDAPNKINWPTIRHSYTLGAHSYTLDPAKKRPDAPPPLPKPVSKKERRRRIANELAARLVRGPPLA